MTKVARCKNYSVLNQRLLEKIKEKGLNLTDLARETGLSFGTVQKLVTDPTCNPTISSLEIICQILGTSVSYLLGHERLFHTESCVLLNWDNLEILINQVDDLRFDEEFKKQTITTSYPCSNTAFSLKMVGNSMLPLFPDGSLLVFDKQKKYYDNGYILLRLKQSNKFVFKQLLIDEPHYYIRSSNPTFSEQLTKLEPGDMIMATLVQSQLQF